MRRIILLVVLLLITLVDVSISQAEMVHYLECKNCHAPGVSLFVLGGMCETCHNSGFAGIDTLDNARSGPDRYFTTNDVSNAMGTHTAINPSEQISHNWNRTGDLVPAAGALPATSSLYVSRYNASAGKITCSKCHNPHANYNPMGPNTALRMDNSADALCRDCHRSWDMADEHALLTHPIIDDYATAIAKPENSGKYNDNPVNSDKGTLQLVNNGVSCSSCHRPHWVDSDASTDDGYEQLLTVDEGKTTGLVSGDGKLLRTDGRQKNPNTLCQGCHKYAPHGNDQIGCLDCHSGHSYNNGVPNYYVLRGSITQVASKKTGGMVDLSGLYYGDNPDDLVSVPVPNPWRNGGGGYCEACHDMTDHSSGPLVGGVNECDSCHNHATSSGAFGGACNSCHGYAPSTSARVGAAPETGPAAGYSGHDEGVTPHINHSDPLEEGSGNHDLSCLNCHDDFDAATSSHNDGSFNDVVFATVAGSASYNGTSCSNVYCHSNGNGSNYATVTWPNGRRSAALDCTGCHGNDTGSMSTAGNSGAHGAHLTAYSSNCDICHTDTASNSTTLKLNGARVVSSHVDGTADVTFNTSYSLGSGTLGSTNIYADDSDCSTVYCHSNGRGAYPARQLPETGGVQWSDVGEANKCGACHQVKSPAAGIIYDITPLGGAHQAHVFASSGPDLACNACHTNNGGGSADHLNGEVSLITDYQTAVCNPCHGATDGLDDATDINPDRQPVWARASSVDCKTCHTGSELATVSSKVAPDKSTATSTGHNKANGQYLTSNNPAAVKACTDCHDADALGHFDGVSDDDKRLVSGFDCQSCHGSSGSATKNEIVTHSSKTCETCHDPHGGSNLYMVRSVSSDYSGTVFFTTITDANSYDEDDSANADDLCATCHTSTTHNLADASGPAHNEGTDCFGCHKTHTEATGAFIAGAGTSCDGCHGFPPDTNAHAVHAPDALDLDAAGEVLDSVDMSACDHCHSGADLYTYDPSVDRSSGVANRENHGAGETTQDATLFDSVGYDSTDLNCASACHASTASDGAWNDTALNCDACHYHDSGAALTSTNNSADVNSLGGSHGKHFDIGDAVACSDCHVVDSAGAALTHLTGTGATEIAKIQDMAAAVQHEATITAAALGADGADPSSSGSNSTCNNIACHNPSGAVAATSYSAEWSVANVDGCAFCHAGSGGDPATGSHDEHLGADTTFGISIGCAGCHGTLPGSNAHRDGTIALGVLSDPATEYMDGATAANLTDFTSSSWGACETATCHNDGTSSATAVVTPKWGTTSADCTICHANGPDSGEHTTHLNNTTYVDGGCVDCHAAETASTHIDGTRNLGGQITDVDLGTADNQLETPGSWAGTCTNNCHIADNASDWTSGSNTLACADCHGSGKTTTPAMDRGWPPSQGAHGAHFGNFYVSGSNCTDCHGDNSSSHSPLDNSVPTATGTKLTVNGGDGSCTNSCHLAAETDDWTGGSAAITCVDCHVTGKIGGAGNMPSSGLHNVTPSVTGKKHDSSVSGGCAACHSDVMAETTHVDGTFEGGNNQTTEMGLASFYTQSADNTGTCSATGCHYEVNSGTTGSSDDWAHAWNSTADYYTTKATACAGCHGDWTNGWNSGVTHRTSSGTSSTHGDTFTDFSCGECHVLEAASGSYTFTFSTADWHQATGETSNHGNGTIEVNSKGTYLKDTTRLCDACHKSVDGTHDFADTAWAVNASLLGDNISASCSSCHGGGVTTGGTGVDSIWPGGGETTDSAGSADDDGLHTLHMTELALRKHSMTLQELVDDSDSLTKQKGLCEHCHAANTSDDDHMEDDNADVFVTTIATVSTRKSLSFWGSDSDAAYSAGSCSLVDCHNNTSVGVAWYSAPSSTCSMCHTTGGTLNPSSGLHLYNATYTDVEGHDDDFGGANSYGCADCHADPPTDAHINGTSNTPATATFSFDTTNKTIKLGSDLADSTDDTCAAACHTDNNTWYRFWDGAAYDDTAVNITQALPNRCDVCHGTFGNWAEGTSHAGTYQTAASTVGQSHNSQKPADNPGAACEDCHVYPSVDLHENGKITLNDSDGTDQLQTGDDLNPAYDATHQVWVCEPCHAVVADELPPNANSQAFPDSSAFPTVERIAGAHIPAGACFSGAQGCHGDTSQRWWPDAETTDPVPSGNVSDPQVYNSTAGVWEGYPNRAGSHPAHNITIGELICETRQGLSRGGCSTTDGNSANDPTDEDYNNTCSFCHPMTNVAGTLKATNHVDGVVDVYGGFNFNLADKYGLTASMTGGSWNSYDAISGDGYVYQLDNPEDPGSLYPLDTDGSYRQYLYNQRGEASVNHGTCSNVACHSNAPFTPNWYGDEQAPAAISDLAAATHDTRETHVAGETDKPGTVLLTWTAPGDNGTLDGTAYEYEVYYSTSQIVDEGDLVSASRAGGAPTVLRKGDAQEMVVDGLTPGTDYYFAVRTKDQPEYKDTDGDGVRETFVREGNLSPLATSGPIAAHNDDVDPTFWGINQAYSHDSGAAINVSWEAARDHTLPIIYRIYYSTYSLKNHLANGGTLPDPSAAAYAGGVDTFNYGEGAPPVADGGDYDIHVTTTRSLKCQLKGLASGVLYNILVRAEDGISPTPNVDGNTISTMAMTSSIPQEDEVTMLYLLNGAAAMQVQADPLNPDWGTVSSGSTSLTAANSFTLQASTDLDDTLSRNFWIQGVSLDLHVENTDRRLPQSFSVQLGYDTGSGFTPVGASVDAGLGRRASRVMKLSLSANTGEIPADANLAIRVTRTTSDAVTTSAINFAWGDSTNKGQLLINAQAINNAPSKPVITEPLVRGQGGYVTVRWTPSDDGDSISQTVHYDIFASCDGSDWCQILGLDLNDTDASTGVVWDTVGSGLAGGSFDCQVRVEASDGYLFEPTPGSDVWESHTLSDPAAITVDNTADDEHPAAATISHVETRPKQGSVYLEWLAVGNDGLNHGTRASYYDIRFRKQADGALTATWSSANGGTITGGTWDDAATVQAEGEPVPAFSGTGEAFEVLNMTPDTPYELGMIVCDSGEDAVAHNSDDNCSPLSNVVSHDSGQYYCGICHSTPPDEPDTRGTHREHGYTLDDCAKCHGDGSGPDGNDVRSYDGRHYDGFINIGWAENSDGTRAELVKIPAASGGSGVSVTQTTDGGDVTVYDDPDGAGGYNAETAYNDSVPLQNTDSGTCSSFIQGNVSGCHGPFNPKWASDTVATRATPTCADCHGDKSSARDTDPYGREWDDSSGGVPSDEIKASPPTDNHGGTSTSDRYTGAHERHLNASFRFAKQDSCRLCHKDTMMAGLHANREVDVYFDIAANESEAVSAVVDDTPADVSSRGVSCSSLNNLFCHDTGARWSEPGAKCNSCHGMAGKDYTPGDPDSVDKSNYIGHVWDGGVARECIHCHVAGHPQSSDGITSGDPDALLLNNNAAIGINYRSGGVHLRQHTGNPSDPNGAVAYRTQMNDGTDIDTLAETCWGCHEDNNISEWGANTSAATGSSAYDFGSLNQMAWTGAIWSSAYGQNLGDPFYYKRGYIQSTHTTDPTGTSAVAWDSANGRYNETPDPISKIRCSNCHDVHDSNLAPGDTMTGRPYLRGTWLSNPYEEDGAPYVKDYSEPQDGLIDYGFGDVPRGGADYDELGGFYIDQNNAAPGTGLDANPTPARYPTSGWTLKNSAGLCTLCHGSNIDEMDQLVDEDPVTAGDQGLWLGNNGHSNSALGGSFSNATNIFDYSHGRPTPVNDDLGGTGRPVDTSHMAVIVPDMAYLSQGEAATAGAGYRGYDTNAGGYIPLVTGTTVTGKGLMPYAYNGYDWGASVDASTTDRMYHQFSCSKCHNPHASRLPKLMITNCLDIRHNLWDDAKSSLQTDYTASALNDVDDNMPAAYYASAQNCHRFDGRRSTSTLRGGWNKVTPWVKDNLNNIEHKGADDPAYTSRSSN